MAKRPKRDGMRAVFVSQQIRRDILAGRLEPGRRLTFPELCAHYAVSVGVLREAFVRLVEHGIVETESNLGFRVMSLSPDDLLNLAAVRVQIEPRFVHEAVRIGSAQWEDELVAAHDLMERTPMIENEIVTEDWVAVHNEFHAVMVSGSGNERMVEITRREREKSDLYRRWYLTGAQLEQSRDREAQEHRDLLDAALARDGALAEKLMREHIQVTTETWITGCAPEPSLATS